ncbi:MAG: hypothetical protein Q8M94_06615 [Ignavibacteria bacterium]|nr:hypothetical protein [Ignavibacteria bacterium]
MKEIDSLYIAGLLHDIGKFIERAKLTDWQEDVKVYTQIKNHRRTMLIEDTQLYLLKKSKKRKNSLTNLLG